MNNKTLITGVALAALVSTGLSLPSNASAEEVIHKKVRKERVAHKRDRHEEGRGHKADRVVIHEKRVKTVRVGNNPHRHDRHSKPGRGHAYGYHHGHRRDFGWYRDRHHRHSHSYLPRKHHRMKKHHRHGWARHHHRHDDRRYRHHDHDRDRVRFHIEYSTWF